MRGRRVATNRKRHMGCCSALADMGGGRARESQMRANRPSFQEYQAGAWCIRYVKGRSRISRCSYSKSEAAAAALNDGSHLPTKRRAHNDECRAEILM
ncbi:hypothetical protein LZ32DRAFT_604719 [Colletotrichum eremochloae]|nr:hypothetical protein LZ32DRAFT_604719 [Colletotrichum eremochloae]